MGLDLPRPLICHHSHGHPMGIPISQTGSHSHSSISRVVRGQNVDCLFQVLEDIVVTDRSLSSLVPPRLLLWALPFLPHSCWLVPAHLSRRSSPRHHPSWKSSLKPSWTWHPLWLPESCHLHPSVSCHAHCICRFVCLPHPGVGGWCLG